MDTATQRWDGEMRNMTSHSSGGHTESFPHDVSHVSFCAAAPPDHSQTPPQRSYTEAKQRQMSLQWQVGSMGA